MRKIPVLLTIGIALTVVAACQAEQVSPVGNVPTSTTAPSDQGTPPTVGTSVPRAAACRAAPSVVQSLPAVDGLPPVGEEDYPRGPADAAVTVIEYAHFQ